MKFKKGDKIKMLAGKDKGKEGKILRVLKEAGKVAVEGLNLVKKHQKPRRQGEKGQLVEVPRAVSSSNVKLLCPACGQAARIGYRFSEDGLKKKRFCKKCQQAL